MNKDGTSHRIFCFLRWFCPGHLYEEIEGDLIQRFIRDAREFVERTLKAPVKTLKYE
jgi:hypothetical protein